MNVKWICRKFVYWINEKKKKNLMKTIIYIGTFNAQQNPLMIGFLYKNMNCVQKYARSWSIAELVVYSNVDIISFHLVWSLRHTIFIDAKNTFLLIMWIVWFLLLFFPISNCGVPSKLIILSWIVIPNDLSNFRCRTDNRPLVCHDDCACILCASLTRTRKGKSKNKNKSHGAPY